MIAVVTKCINCSNQQKTVKPWETITICRNCKKPMSNNKEIAFPEPKIGYYYSECCLLDLYKIETEEDLGMVKERIKENDEEGELMIFATKEEAINYLK